MSHDVTRSLELYKKAGERIPGWTQLISRRADRVANGVSPLYVARSKARDLSMLMAMNISIGFALWALLFWDMQIPLSMVLLKSRSIVEVCIL